VKVVLTQYTGTLILVLVLILLFGLYLSWTATRLDRLLDVATAVILATAAREAQVAPEEEREPAESALTRDLRAAFDDPVQLAQLRETPEGTDLVQELGAAMRRVQLARRFHNESVRAIRLLRAHRRVRYFRLAGRAPDKPTFEIDDEPPVGLAR
jgi:hypothetical protein